MPEPQAHAGLVAFRYSNFTLFVVARFFLVAALEMQSVAVGWQIYEITRRPLDLGLVGLAQFLPVVFLFLPAGHAADRFNRKRLVVVCYVGFAVCYGLLLQIARAGARDIRLIYAVLVLLAVVRAFNPPAARWLLPLALPPEFFPDAVAWLASTSRASSMPGP